MSKHKDLEPLKDAPCNATSVEYIFQWQFSDTGLIMRYGLAHSLAHMTVMKEEAIKMAKTILKNYQEPQTRHGYEIFPAPFYDEYWIKPPEGEPSFFGSLEECEAKLEIINQELDQPE